MPRSHMYELWFIEWGCGECRGRLNTVDLSPWFRSRFEWKIINLVKDSEQKKILIFWDLASPRGVHHRRLSGHVPFNRDFSGPCSLISAVDEWKWTAFLSFYWKRSSFHFWPNWTHQRVRAPGFSSTKLEKVINQQHTVYVSTQPKIKPSSQFMLSPYV